MTPPVRRPIRTRLRPMDTAAAQRPTGTEWIGSAKATGGVPPSRPPVAVTQAAVGVLRRPITPSPARALPNSQTAAGIGTAEVVMASL